MQEKSSNAPTQNFLAVLHTSAVQSEQSTAPASTPEKARPRKAYGTAKTENLRDSGLWRYVLPVTIMLFCVSLLAIPLIILIPLLSNSLDVHAAANQAHISLTWLWVLMIVIEVSIAALIIKGFASIFLTQAGNYRR
ncbi:MAG: hypothetical protein JO202_01340 [Ktedonobacteraceae bacterium]|nr:hypothetical protein [Ktedonobacteraceae bacterium]